MMSAPILALPNFDRVFKVDCGESHMGIGAVLSQDIRPITYFIGKLNGNRIGITLRMASNFMRSFKLSSIGDIT